MKRLLLTLSLIPALFGAESDPAIREFYDEKAEIRMRNFEKPDDVVIKLWADESQTQNPSAITFDSKGRLYVAEINRWRTGVDDIRERRMMLVEDIQIESNADRLKMFQNHADQFPMEYYSRNADQISLLEDTDGDGRADSSKIFAGGFNDPLDGPGIGLIERRQNLLHECSSPLDVGGSGRRWRVRQENVFAGRIWNPHELLGSRHAWIDLGARWQVVLVNGGPWLQCAYKRGKALFRTQ